MRGSFVWSFLSNAAFRRRKAYRYALVDEKKVTALLDSSAPTDELHARIEESLMTRYGTDHAILTGSGNHAFSIICKGLRQRGVKSIALQAYTCKQLVPLAKEQTLRVRLLETSKLTGNCLLPLTDFRKQEAFHAIHTFGAPLPLEDLKETAAKQTPIVEDSAHALGAGWPGQKTDDLFFASLFSFRKNLSVGSGGALITSDERLAKQARDHTLPPGKIERRAAWGQTALQIKQWRAHDAWPYPLYSRYEYSGTTVSRVPMTRLDACVCLDQLHRIDEINAINRETATRLFRALEALEHVRALQVAEKTLPTFTRFGFVFDDPLHAKRFQGKALRGGFETGMNYSKDLLENLREAGASPADFLQSADLAAKMVPIGITGLLPADIDQLIEWVIRADSPHENA